jgi:hypothetical protein
MIKDILINKKLERREYHYKIWNLKYLGYVALLPAIGFMYIYLLGYRKTGPETFGDKIWWNDLRPIHSMLYFLFAYNAIKGNKQAWMYLLVDVIFGLIKFLMHQ